MAVRRATGWLLAFPGVSVVCLAAALAAGWEAVALQQRANDYWNRLDFDQIGAQPATQEQFDYANGLWTDAGSLSGLVAPLLTVALGAFFVLLAVLAARRDQRDAAGASVAS